MTPRVHKRSAFMSKRRRLGLFLPWLLIMANPQLWALRNAELEESHAIHQPSKGERAIVRGTVIDAETRAPLQNVVVWVQGDDNTSVTDDEGRFDLLDIAPGRHVLCLSSVNYVFVRREIDVGVGTQEELTIPMFGGAATYSETVTVVAQLHGETEPIPTDRALNGIPLQNLSRGVIDDPVRAVQSLPGVVTGDDFRAEYSVRGKGPEKIGASFESVPSSLLLYAVHRDDDVTASVINSDTVDNITLSTGVYPQRYGDKTGAWMDITMREGSREKTQVHALAGLTMSSVAVGGPFGSGEKGSYLLSGRWNYMDRILRALDQTNSAFGAADTQGKIVYDVTESNQFQLSWLGGRFQLDNSHERDFATLSDDWRTDNKIGLLTAALRSTFGPRWMLTQRVAAVLNRYETEGFFGADLEHGFQKELSYRADVTFEPSPTSMLNAGLQAQQSSGTLTIMGYGWTDASQQTIEMLRNDRYEGDSWRHGAYLSYRWRPSSSWTFSPGIRADRLTLTGETTTSPWISVGWTPVSNWEVTAGTGIYHQYPDLYQVLGPTPGGRDLRAERTWHTDISVTRHLNAYTRLVATAYTWEDRDGIRRVNGEPRMVNDELFWPNYRGQWYANVLEGSSRGIELMFSNKNPNGLSGWVSYALSHTRYLDIVTNEEFWGDFDQRHTFNAYGQYRWSHRTSVSALFRYGSNFPLVGYYELRDGVWTVGSHRNTERLPYYARLDVRADRTFASPKWRMTLFAQVLNVLDHENARRLPHRIRSGQEYRGPYQWLLGMTPTVGALIEF